MSITLHHGDCLEILKTLPDNSVDSIVTDPPYGLSNHETEDVVECLTNWLAGKEYKPNKKGFMGKSWDGWVPGPEVWKECLRVLKPGGHLLAFAGTRTMDLMYMAIRLAGFELRDSIGHANNASLVAWMHGQGFPKNLDLSRAIDKEAGAKREVIGEGKWASVRGAKRSSTQGASNGGVQGGYNFTDTVLETAPATEAAKQWEGFGTAIKPAWEPIVLARKPISEKTVAKNVLKWGCGGLNIDGTRLEAAANDDGVTRARKTGKKDCVGNFGFHNDEQGYHNPRGGRFPSNVVFSHSIFCTDDSCHESCAVKMLDAQSGNLSKQGSPKIKNTGDKSAFGGGDLSSYFGDSGGASRFFYCAKVSPSERGDSTHPTMKSLKLMGYLCRLVTPPKGVVLDPFMGSGSTGVAALKEGFQFIGVEKEEEYFEIAKRRIGVHGEIE